jgi:hypothetical protein
MDRGSKQFQRVNHREVSVFPGDPPCRGDPDAEKTIAFPVLAGTGLEKTLKDGGIRFIRRRPQFGACGFNHRFVFLHHDLKLSFIRFDIFASRRIIDIT